MKIPEPPREPRWPPCLARRWVLGLAGLVLAGLGSGLWVASVITGAALLPADLVVGAIAGPGVVLLGAWLRGVLRLRVLLREGTLTRAEILQVDPVPGVSPPQLRLRYRLRDADGQTHEARQHVRAASTLGRRLRERPPALAVIHDPHDPGFSRAVGAEDFAPAPGPGTAGTQTP